MKCENKIQMNRRRQIMNRKFIFLTTIFSCIASTAAISYTTNCTQNFEYKVDTVIGDSIYSGDISKGITLVLSLGGTIKFNDENPAGTCQFTMPPLYIYNVPDPSACRRLATTLTEVFNKAMSSGDIYGKLGDVGMGGSITVSDEHRVIDACQLNVPIISVVAPRSKS